MTTTVSVPVAQHAGPSSWSHRLPVIILALVGGAVAGYLSLYQLHITSSVWDPLFGSAISFLNAGLGCPEVLATLRRRHA